MAPKLIATYCILRLAQVLLHLDLFAAFLSNAERDLCTQAAVQPATFAILLRSVAVSILDIQSHSSGERASVRAISLRQSNKKARSTPDTIPSVPSSVRPSDDRSGPDDDDGRAMDWSRQTDSLKRQRGPYFPPTVSLCCAPPSWV